MHEDKHKEALREVLSTIDEAVSSSDMLLYQRRLIAMISLGLQHAVELYLHRLKVIKPGASVKHSWFGLGERNTILAFDPILTKPFQKIEKLGTIVSLARTIESDRNDILYGSPLIDDRLLRKKIDAFLEIKRIIEETGDVA